MKTGLSAERLAESGVAAQAAELKKCVQCGFCTATCPTYTLLGDERDGPRGRIQLMREMLASDAAPPAGTVRHVDRCLSCLACKSACPSGVDYAVLVDAARARIEAYRPAPVRALRAMLAWILTDRGRFAVALRLGRLARPLAPLAARLGLKPMAAMLDLAHAPAGRPGAEPSPPQNPRGRVILLKGCVEPVLSPDARAAAARLLTRMGFEVLTVAGEGCCGALSEHLGRVNEAETMARANLAAWAAIGPVDAVIATAAGCGTALKSYGRLVGTDLPARDILEFIADAGPPPMVAPEPLTVAYHAACSLRHGQGIVDAPPRLLADAGFTVRTPAESHLCCGSAGVYNILQNEIATQLRDRKAERLNATGADIIAAGNVGCAAQLAAVVSAPIVHPVELLDWASGGPRPPRLGGKR
jgi:glycolate oxidase iron-sulfur subunit